MGDSKDWKPEELIQYIESHAKTERALCHRDMFKRFLDLTWRQVSGEFPEWICLHDYNIELLVREARSNMETFGNGHNEE